MASQKIERFGPLAMPTAATNMINPAAAGAGAVGYTASASRIILRHIRITNKTASPVTAMTLYIGATGGSAAGTEFAFANATVAANSYVEWYGLVALASTDFLSEVCGTVTALVFEAEGEIGLA